MAMLRTKRSQAAQGMVEFALVLPILLLVLLGIIAFGHLFFVYSFTVASSREAARWGAAVGVTDAGLPRYRDCASIRAAAQRVGGIIGVTSDRVTINFDHGPGTGSYADCPLGGEGPDVQLGDRIIVRIDITYEPIVPLVELPTFPLQGITTRTIIRSLPVGDAPTAESPCYNTVTAIVVATAPLDIGVWENFTYLVKAKNVGDPSPASGDGKVDIVIDGVKVETNKPTTGSFTHNFNMYGTHQIQAVYTSSNVNFCNSTTSYNYSVRIPSLAKFISDTPDPSDPRQRFTVTVEAVPEPDGIIMIPTGQVVVYDALDKSVGCIINLDATGKGSCDFRGYPYIGLRNLIARYQGDDVFAASPDSAPAEHTISGVPTPTLIVPPTVTPSPTPVLSCPVMVGQSYNFSDQLNGFFLSISNLDWLPVTITKITVTWPSQLGGDALLQEIRFASNTDDASAKCDLVSPAGSCLWGTTNPLSPESRVIGVAPNNFFSSAGLTLQPNEIKQLRMVYNANLPDTDPKDRRQTKYQITVEFDKQVFGKQCVITGPASERDMIP